MTQAVLEFAKQIEAQEKVKLNEYTNDLNRIENNISKVSSDNLISSVHASSLLSGKLKTKSAKAKPTTTKRD